MIYVFPESGKLKKCKKICVFHNQKNDLFSSTDLGKNYFLEKFKLKKTKITSIMINNIKKKNQR